MTTESKDAAPLLFRIDSSSGLLAEVGLLTIDLQVQGRDYRWSQKHGLVRREEGANVSIPGTETEAWQQLETLLLMPGFLGAALALGIAIKSLEASESERESKQSAGERREA